MIRRLFVQVVESISVATAPEADTTDREAALRLATAVLMIDVARADRVFDESGSMQCCNSSNRISN